MADVKMPKKFLKHKLGELNTGEIDTNKISHQLIKAECKSPETTTIHRKSERRRVARDIFLVFEQQQPVRRKGRYNNRKGVSKSKFSHLKVENLGIQSQRCRARSIRQKINKQKGCSKTPEKESNQILKITKFYRRHKAKRTSINSKNSKFFRKTEENSLPTSICNTKFTTINPIFLWAKQDDTRIIEVRCEDYDRRNRIRITKTTTGWRAVPRSDASTSRIVKYFQTPSPCMFKNESHDHKRLAKIAETECIATNVGFDDRCLSMVSHQASNTGFNMSSSVVKEDINYSKKGRSVAQLKTVTCENKARIKNIIESRICSLAEPLQDTKDKSLEIETLILCPQTGVFLHIDSTEDLNQNKLTPEDSKARCILTNKTVSSHDSSFRSFDRDTTSLRDLLDECVLPDNCKRFESNSKVINTLLNQSNEATLLKENKKSNVSTLTNHQITAIDLPLKKVKSFTRDNDLQNPINTTAVLHRITCEAPDTNGNFLTSKQQHVSDVNLKNKHFNTLNTKSSKLDIPNTKLDLVSLLKSSRDASHNIPTITIDKKSSDEPEKKKICGSASVNETLAHVKSALSPAAVSININRDPDPLTQLQLLLKSTRWKVPDPILVPKERLGAVLASPAREIPLLITTRPELRLPEAFAYPYIIQNPNILVISMAQLETILTNEMFVGRHEEDVTLGSLPSTSAEMSPKSTTRNANTTCSYIDKNKMSTNINAATLAVLNQMLLLPYISQWSQGFIQTLKTPTNKHHHQTSSFISSLNNFPFGLEQIDDLYLSYTNQIANLKLQKPDNNSSNGVESGNTARRKLQLQEEHLHFPHIDKTSSSFYLPKENLSEPNFPSNYSIENLSKNKKFNLTSQQTSNRYTYKQGCCDSGVLLDDPNSVTQIKSITFQNKGKTTKAKPRLTCKSLSNLVEPEKFLNLAEVGSYLQQDKASLSKIVPTDLSADEPKYNPLLSSKLQDAQHNSLVIAEENTSLRRLFNRNRDSNSQFSWTTITASGE